MKRGLAIQMMRVRVRGVSRTERRAWKRLLIRCIRISQGVATHA